MSQNDSHQQETFMVKLATFIVDKRNLFFLLTVIGLIFSVFSRSWVEVENDLTDCLPEDAETKLALNLMEAQFTTYGTAEVMVANVTYSQAETLRDTLADVKGVQSVDFDETTDHYASASALFTVTFDTDESDDACLTALDAVRETLADYALCLSTDLGNPLQGDHRLRGQCHHGLRRHHRGHRPDPHLPDLRGGAGAASDLRGGHGPEPGDQLPPGEDLLRLQLRHQHPAAGAVPGLRRHPLQPLQGAAPDPPHPGGRHRRPEPQAPVEEPSPREPVSH